MMELLVGLIIFGVFALIAAHVWSSMNPGCCQNQQPQEQGEPIDADNGGLESPLFNQQPGERNRIATRAEGFVNNNLWAVGPAGPQLLVVIESSNNELVLENDDYTATAEWDENYLSSTVAERVGGTTGAWRLKTFNLKQPGETATPVRYTTVARRNNRQWFHGTTVYGDFDDDMIDWFLIYYFLFDGFEQPYDYYEGLHPVYEEGGDWVESVQTHEEFEAAEQAEASRLDALEEAKLAAEQAKIELAAQSVVEAEQHEQHRVEPEYHAPEPTHEPPATYEQEESTTKNWGGSSFGGGGGGSYSSGDSGGSYDSGDSGGGGGDD